MTDEKFAKLYAVIYQWPDSEQPYFGFIIHTNYDDPFDAAKAVGISDDDVLIYTDTLDETEIAHNFDGLKVEVMANAN